LLQTWSARHARRNVRSPHAAACVATGAAGVEHPAGRVLVARLRRACRSARALPSSGEAPGRTVPPAAPSTSCDDDAA